MKRQISRLENEGVELVFNTSVSAVSGIEDELTGIECLDLLSREKTARQAGTLLLESGRLPELIFTRTGQEEDGEEAEGCADEDAPAAAETTKDEDLEKDRPLEWIGVPPTKNPASGACPRELISEADAVTDFSAAIRAIAAGRRAAASIHKIMYGIELELPDNVVSEDTIVQKLDSLEDVTVTPRQIMPACSVSDVPGKCREIEKGFSEEAAKKEASRCLRCGLICYTDPAAEKEGDQYKQEQQQMAS